MKKLLLLPLVLVLFSCYEQERKCVDFKTGTFSFEHEIDGEIKKTVFTRTEELEIETFEGKTDTSTIRWVSDCEYILHKKNPKSNADKKGVAIKILNTSKNSYTFEFGMVGSPNRQRGTVTRITTN
jgi:hypothetical protein